jgi:hypothetical protein
MGMIQDAFTKTEAILNSTGEAFIKDEKQEIGALEKQLKC